MTYTTDACLDLTLGVPLKNSAPYLPELLTGLEIQDRFPAQLLFVDDGSTDHSMELVQTFAGRHPEWRIQIERNTASIGIGAVYNQIASAAGQTWVQILDADDYLLKGFFREIAPCLKGNYTGIVTSARSNIAVLNLLSAAAAPFVPKRLPRRLPVLGGLSTRSGVVYRTADLLRQPFTDPAFDGSDILHLARLRADGNFVFVRRAKAFYRVHPAAATARLAAHSPYWQQIRQLPDAGWLYRCDYVLRKKLFAWLRR